MGEYYRSILNNAGTEEIPNKSFSGGKDDVKESASESITDKILPQHAADSLENTSVRPHPLKLRSEQSTLGLKDTTPSQNKSQMLAAKIRAAKARYFKRHPEVDTSGLL